ncbi:hypothetical protein AAG906_016572 [Vitis piasezkii]
MVMKYTMDKSIKECVPKTERAKGFLEYVKANYTKIDKRNDNSFEASHNSVYDGVVKLTYNALKEEWTLEELMSIVVQHEVSLKKNETHSLALVIDQVNNMKKKPPHKNFGGFKQFKRKGNSNQGTSNASASSNAAKVRNLRKVQLCHKIGHKQANCFKFKNWLEKKKKGKIVVMVMVNLNANMIETNIVDVHANSWCLSLHHGLLCDSSSVNSIVGCKHARMNLTSSMLWHKRLGHISRQRLEKLVKDGVLSNLDFSDFETCVVCLKGKMTAKTRKEKIDRYTMPNTPQHNGVVERRNRTLLDMMRCMLSNSSLPKFIWRVRRLAISDDYMVYLQEHEYDGYDAFDPITYQEAIHCPQFTSWKEVIDDEMNSMYMNSVWALVELSHGCKPVGCKWVLRPNVILARK